VHLVLIWEQVFIAMGNGKFSSTTATCMRVAPPNEIVYQYQFASTMKYDIQYASIAHNESW